MARPGLRLWETGTNLLFAVLWAGVSPDVGLPGAGKSFQSLSQKRALLPWSKTNAERPYWHS